MSLYDGLGIDNKDGGGETKTADVSGWSSTYKLLQSQLKAKKASNVSLPGKRKSNAGVLAPVVDLKKNLDGAEMHFNLQTGKLERRLSRDSAPRRDREPIRESPRESHNDSQRDSHPSTPKPSGDHTVRQKVSRFTPMEPVASLTGVTDEYDPLKPNDYDAIMREKRAQKRERDEERRREMEDNRDGGGGRNRSSLRRDDEGSEFQRARRRKDEDEENDRPVRSMLGGKQGAAIAPPSSLLEEEPHKGTDSPPVDRGSPPPGGFMIGGSGGTVASKIMAKYGYRHGQGLGRSEQGMSTALVVEKTSKRGGKILHEKDIGKMEQEKAAQEAADQAPVTMFTNTNLLRNPSKVILLQNMVGPGEVDDDLESETSEECSKYGKVVKCVIFEMPEATEDRAVRIFLEFERVESAIKAVVDLNGRYFGGRMVKACFYNLDKFRRLQLADDVD